MLGKNELQEGLEVIESTNLKYFAKEMTAELYALKGMLLAQIGRADDANKAFSAAVQMHDTLVKAWALWGDHLEQVFTKDSRNISTGVSAITCFLHACRHQNESKSRKYLAKVIILKMKQVKKKANGCVIYVNSNNHSQIWRKKSNVAVIFSLYDTLVLLEAKLLFIISYFLQFLNADRYATYTFIKVILLLLIR